MPALAKSRAACMPPTPPPTTNAAPTVHGCDCSGRICNALLNRGCLFFSLVLHCLEVNGQGPINHVSPFAESHFDDEHWSGKDYVYSVRKMAGKAKAQIARDMCHQTGEYGQKKQDGEDQVRKTSLLIYLLLGAVSSPKNAPDSVKNQRSGQITQHSLRVIERIDIVRLEPA